MKSILIALITFSIWINSFAQNITVSNVYDDFEFKINPEYQTNGENIFYNNGTDIDIKITNRLKIKYPNNSGCNTCYTPNVTFPVFFEKDNGARYIVGYYYYNSFQKYDIKPGNIYTSYFESPMKFRPNILALGKGKIYMGVYYDNDPTYDTADNAYILKTKVDVTFVQVPNFIGPSQICDEATYTIERPDVVTLENAAGVATLTALGNNQWKVTRTGTANGVVKLRSTSNGKTFDKEIKIGSYNSIINLAGNTLPGGVNSGLSAEVYDPSASYLWEVTAGTIVSGQGTANVVVKPNVNNNSNGVPNNFGVKLTFTNSCGTLNINKTYLIPATDGETPDPGEIIE